MLPHPPHPVPVDAASIVGEAGRLAPRQCGRCRKLFDGDATLNPKAMPEWWLCPPCRAILLPGHAGTVVPGGGTRAL